MAVINVSQQFTEIPAKDAVVNATWTDVIGNKTDVSAVTADVVSIVGLLRYIIANISTDTDVAALIGALNTAAATGAVGNSTTVMGYVKQLITDLRTVKGDLDNGGRLDLIIDDILADTAELQADWTNGGRLDLLLDAIKAVTDVLPNAGALSSLAQDSTVAKASVLGAAVGASISADIASVKTDTTKVGTVTNSGGTASIGAILGDFANTTLVSKFAVPTQDLATDATIAQVVGKKSDTTAGTSIVALVKLATSYLTGATAIPAAAKREAGRTQVKKVAITSAANAGLVTLATATTKGCLIKTVTLRASSTGQVDLTSAAIKCGGATGETVTLISAATAVKNSIDTVDEQVSYNGVVALPATGIITIDLQGTGATAVALEAVIEYVAVEDSGYLN